MTKVTVLIGAVSLLMGLGCSKDRRANMSRGGTPTASAATGHAMMGQGTSGPAAMTPHDPGFIDAMIPHHQSAIDMSKVALEKGEHAEIRELAQRIITAQQAEIDKLEAWRRAWYPEFPPTDGMAMPLAMGPGLSADAAVPFDHRFIDAMIPHHEGAIVMATTARTAAEHAEIREFAERIVTSKQAEIDTMKTWRTTWYAR